MGQSRHSQPLDSNLTRHQEPHILPNPNENEEQYIQTARQNEHNRQETIKDELHNWILWFIRAFLAAALIAGIVFFWHMITPDYFTWNDCKLMKLHFLSDKQLEKVSAFFVTIVLSSTFTGYAKKYLK